MYIVGKIVNTHGIRGEVKIINLSDFDRFSINSVIYYDNDNKLTIEQVRPHKNILIVKFKEFSNINDCLFLKGKEVFVKEKVETEDNSYYYDELIGLPAYDKDIFLGKIVSLLEVPQGHILEIIRNDKKILVPFVNEFIKEVLEDRVILDLIEGFYED